MQKAGSALAPSAAIIPTAAPQAASSAQPTASLPVYDSVSAYEKLHRIGEGTYGVVCECTVTARCM